MKKTIRRADQDDFSPDDLLMVLMTWRKPQERQIRMIPLQMPFFWSSWHEEDHKKGRSGWFLSKWPSFGPLGMKKTTRRAGLPQEKGRDNAQVVRKALPMIIKWSKIDKGGCRTNAAASCHHQKSSQVVSSYHKLSQRPFPWNFSQHPQPSTNALTCEQSKRFNRLLCSVQPSTNALTCL